jgi:ion channel
MHIFSLIAGLVVIVAVLLDAFETVVLPRRVHRNFRLTNVFYGNTWRPWARLSMHIKSNTRREAFLGYFGPLSLIVLLGLWAMGLIFGFSLLQFGGGEHIASGNQPITFGLLVYHSGETFFTLGYGDVVPSSAFSRTLSVLEAGLGFGFLGMVIGYLPTIYSSFSRREVEISLLDARAGSPPTAAELLARFGKTRDQAVLDEILREWERWSAELLESHLSYPPLSFFRSQHSNQSWLGALTTILDASSLIIAGIDDVRSDQAKLTFAMARHAVVDLAQVVYARYDPDVPERLPAEEMARLREMLSNNGIKLKTGPEFEQKLSYLRSLYEPYTHGVARNMVITIPPWIFKERNRDNWQSGPWDRAIQARSLAGLSKVAAQPLKVDDHF